MFESRVWAVSIHDMHPSGFLSFDLGSIIECLEDRNDFLWIPVAFECEGEEVPSLVPQDTTQFLAALGRSDQTIDATVIGVERHSLSAIDLGAATDLLQFPTSAAQLAILAVDSSYFDVLTKNPCHIEQVARRFTDVRIEDPANYFG